MTHATLPKTDTKTVVHRERGIICFKTTYQLSIETYMDLESLAEKGSYEQAVREKKKGNLHSDRDG